MTTTTIQTNLQPQLQVSASTPNSQGRYSLNCTAFIKLVTAVTSIAATVIAYLAEQYLIATLTASLAAFTIYSYFRGEPTSAPQNPTVPPAPEQTPNSPRSLPHQNPQNDSGTPSRSLSPAPQPSPRGGSGTPTSGQTPNPLQPLPLPNQTGGFGTLSKSPITSPPPSRRSASSNTSVIGTSSENSTPRDLSIEVKGNDELPVEPEGTARNLLTPINQTGGTSQPESFERASAGVSTGSSTTSLSSPPQGLSEEILQLPIPTEATALNPLPENTGTLNPKNPNPLLDSEEGSVVESSDQGQEPDSRGDATIQTIPSKHSSQDAGDEFDGTNTHPSTQSASTPKKKSGGSDVGVLSSIKNIFSLNKSDSDSDSDQ